MQDLDARSAEMRAARTAEDPCSRTTPHMAHRNWQSDDVGVCPGVHTVKEDTTT